MCFIVNCFFFILFLSFVSYVIILCFNFVFIYCVFIFVFLLLHFTSCFFDGPKAHIFLGLQKAHFWPKFRPNDGPFLNPWSTPKQANNGLDRAHSREAQTAQSPTRQTNTAQPQQALFRAAHLQIHFSREAQWPFLAMLLPTFSAYVSFMLSFFFVCLAFSFCFLQHAMVLTRQDLELHEPHDYTVTILEPPVGSQPSWPTDKLLHQKI